MKTLSTLLLLSLSTTFLPGCAAPRQDAGRGDPGLQAVRRLARRVLGRDARSFLFERLPGPGPAFELSQAGERIRIRGTAPWVMAAGLGWYLKHYARCEFSWCGNRIDLPKPLPPVRGKELRRSPYRFGFYFNYCTFSYSMPWWDWKRWEREIDLMALSGIDMPLAVTGSEALWLRFLIRFGYSKKEALAFIAGPAYQAWWLMGNLEGRGGPVTEAWIASRVRLQRRILARMRSLGMRPVLPGFVGIVPSNLPEKVPGTRVIPQGKWGGINIRPPVLHPKDPLFDRMARAWYEILEGLYGKPAALAGDLFHEGGRTGGLDVPAMAAKVQAAMLRCNPQAIWVLQAWGANPRKALLEALDRKHTLVVDLCCEFWKRWQKRKGYGGYPWVFSTIIDYGGNPALHGRLDALAGNLGEALSLPRGLRPSGLGATWEGIENNPVVFEFLWDLRWRKEVPDLESWIGDYAVRRYGTDDPKARKAWLLLVRGPYKAWPGQRRPGESLFCARPSLNVKKASPFAASIRVHYDQRILRDAVALLLSHSKRCGAAETYRFDLVDFTRQFLANLGQVTYRRMVEAYRRKDAPAFRRFEKLFLEMLDEQDRLLAADERFLLGKWLHDAVSCAPDPVQAVRNQRQARILITTWNRERSHLRDYAWREWNGMIRTFYKPRWETFLAELERTLETGKPRKIDFFPFEAAWAARSWKDDPHPWKPSGDPVKACRRILERYGPLLDDPGFYSPPGRGGKGGARR